MSMDCLTDRALTYMIESRKYGFDFNKGKWKNNKCKKKFEEDWPVISKKEFPEEGVRDETWV